MTWYQWGEVWYLWEISLSCVINMHYNIWLDLIRFDSSRAGKPQARRNWLRPISLNTLYTVFLILCLVIQPFWELGQQFCFANVTFLCATICNAAELFSNKGSALTMMIELWSMIRGEIKKWRLIYYIMYDWICFFGRTEWKACPLPVFRTDNICGFLVFQKQNGKALIVFP